MPSTCSRTEQRDGMGSDLNNQLLDIKWDTDIVWVMEKGAPDNSKLTGIALTLVRLFVCPFSSFVLKSSGSTFGAPR
jgi:hypothetical protein